MRWFRRKPRMVARTPDGWQSIFDLQDAATAVHRRWATLPTEREERPLRCGVEWDCEADLFGSPEQGAGG